MKKLLRSKKSNVFYDFSKVLTSLALAYTVSLTPAFSQQIIVDGNTNTTLNTNGTITDVSTTTIKGSNAFNSFSRFNVDAGNTVNLVVPNGSTNLINLVHDEASVINGKLQSMQAGNICGNIFLVNPHGITVGTQGVINVGSLTAVTPTTDFMNTFFTAPGDPADASVISLINGTAPINDAATITIEDGGVINAIGDVKLDAGAIESEGQIYTNANYGLSPDLSDIVNLNTAEYNTYDELKLVIQNGSVELKAINDIKTGSIYAGENINVDTEAKFTVENSRLDAGNNIILTSKDDLILPDQWDESSIFITSYLEAGNNIEIKAPSIRFYPDSAFGQIYGYTNLKAGNDITIQPYDINSDHMESIYHTNFEAGGDITLSSAYLFDTDVIAQGNIIANNYLNVDELSKVQAVNGDIRVTGLFYSLANAESNLGIQSPEFIAGNDIIVDASIDTEQIIINSTNFTAGNNIDFKGYDIFIAGDSKLTATTGKIDIVSDNLLGIYGINHYEPTKIGYLGSPEITAGGDISIVSNYEPFDMLPLPEHPSIQDFTNNYIISGEAKINGNNINLSSNHRIRIGVYTHADQLNMNYPLWGQDNISSGATINATNHLSITGKDWFSIQDTIMNSGGLLTLNSEIQKIYFVPNSITAGSLSSNFIAQNAPIDLINATLANLDHFTIGGSPLNPTNIIAGTLIGDVSSTGDITCASIKNGGNIHTDGNLTVTTSYIEGGNISANNLLTINNSGSVILAPDSITAGSLSSDFLVQNGDLNISSSASVDEDFWPYSINIANLDHITIGGQPLNPTSISLSGNVVRVGGDISTTGNINLTSNSISIASGTNINTFSDMAIDPTSLLEIEGGNITANNLTLNGGNINNKGIIFTPESITASTLTSDFLAQNSALNLTSTESIEVGNINNITIAGSPLNVTEISLDAGSEAAISGAITTVGDISLVGKSTTVKAGSNIQAENISLNPIDNLFVEGGNIIALDTFTANKGSSTNNGNLITFIPDSIQTVNLNSDFLVHNGDLTINDYNIWEIKLGNLDNITVNGTQFNPTNIDIENYRYFVELSGNISSTGNIDIGCPNNIYILDNSNIHADGNVYLNSIYGYSGGDAITTIGKNVNITSNADISITSVFEMNNPGKNFVAVGEGANINAANDLTFAISSDYAGNSEVINNATFTSGNRIGFGLYNLYGNYIIKNTTFNSGKLIQLELLAENIIFDNLTVTSTENIGIVSNNISNNSISFIDSNITTGKDITTGDYIPTPPFFMQSKINNLNLTNTTFTADENVDIEAWGAVTLDGTSSITAGINNSIETVKNVYWQDGKDIVIGANSLISAGNNMTLNAADDLIINGTIEAGGGTSSLLINADGSRGPGDGIGATIGDEEVKVTGIVASNLINLNGNVLGNGTISILDEALNVEITNNSSKDLILTNSSIMEFIIDFSLSTDKQLKINDQVITSDYNDITVNLFDNDTIGEFNVTNNGASDVTIDDISIIADGDITIDTQGSFTIKDSKLDAGNNIILTSKDNITLFDQYDEYSFFITSNLEAGNNIEINAPFIRFYPDSAFGQIFGYTNLKAGNDITIQPYDINRDHGDDICYANLEAGGDITLSGAHLFDTEIIAQGNIISNNGLNVDELSKVQAINGDIIVTGLFYALAFESNVGIQSPELIAGNDIIVDASIDAEQIIINSTDLTAGNNIDFKGKDIFIFGDSKLTATSGNIDIVSDDFLGILGIDHYEPNGLSYFASPEINAGGDVSIVSNYVPIVDPPYDLAINFIISGESSISGNNINLSSNYMTRIGLNTHADQLRMGYSGFPAMTYPLIGYDTEIPSGATINATNNLTINDTNRLEIEHTTINAGGLFTLNSGNSDSIYFVPDSVTVGSLSSNIFTQNAAIDFSGATYISNIYLGNLDHFTIGGSPLNPTSIIAGTLMGDVSSTGDITIAAIENGGTIHSDGNLTVTTSYIEGGNISADNLLTINDSGRIILTADSITAGSLSSDFLVQNGDLNILSSASVIEGWLPYSIDIANLDNIIIGGQPLNPTSITLGGNAIRFGGNISTTGNINLTSTSINIASGSVINTPLDMVINPTSLLEIEGGSLTANNLTLNGGNINNNGIIFTPESITASTLTSDFLAQNSALNLTSTESIIVGNFDNISIGGSPLNVTEISLDAGSEAAISGAITTVGDISLVGESTTIKAGSIIQAENISLNPTDNLFVEGGNITAIDTFTINKGTNNITFTPDSITTVNLDSDFLFHNGDLSLGGNEIKLGNLDNITVDGNQFNPTNILIQDAGSWGSLELSGNISTTGNLNALYHQRVFIASNSNIHADGNITLNPEDYFNGAHVVIGKNSSLTSGGDINIYSDARFDGSPGKYFVAVEEGVSINAGNDLYYQLGYIASDSTIINNATFTAGNNLLFVARSHIGNSKIKDTTLHADNNLTIVSSGKNIIYENLNASADENIGIAFSNVYGDFHKVSFINSTLTAQKDIKSAVYALDGGTYEGNIFNLNLTNTDFTAGENVSIESYGAVTLNGTSSITAGLNNSIETVKNISWQDGKDIVIGVDSLISAGDNITLIAADDLIINGTVESGTGGANTNSLLLINADGSIDPSSDIAATFGGGVVDVSDIGASTKVSLSGNVLGSGNITLLGNTVDVVITNNSVNNLLVNDIYASSNQLIINNEVINSNYNSITVDLSSNFVGDIDIINPNSETIIAGQLTASNASIDSYDIKLLDTSTISGDDISIIPTNSLFAEGSISSSNLLTLNGGNIATNGIHFAPESIDTQLLASDFITNNAQLQINSSGALYLDNLDAINVANNPINLTGATLQAEELILKRSTINGISNITSNSGMHLDDVTLNGDTNLDGSFMIFSKGTVNGNLEAEAWAAIFGTDAPVVINGNGNIEVKGSNTAGKFMFYQADVSNDLRIYATIPSGYNTVSAGTLEGSYATNTLNGKIDDNYGLFDSIYRPEVNYGSSRTFSVGGNLTLCGHHIKFDGNVDGDADLTSGGQGQTINVYGGNVGQDSKIYMIGNYPNWFSSIINIGVDYDYNVDGNLEVTIVDNGPINYYGGTVGGNAEFTPGYFKLADDKMLNLGIDRPVNILGDLDIRYATDTIYTNGYVAGIINADVNRDLTISETSGNIDIGTMTSDTGTINLTSNTGSVNINTLLSTTSGINIIANQDVGVFGLIDATGEITNKELIIKSDGSIDNSSTITPTIINNDIIVNNSSNIGTIDITGNLTGDGTLRSYNAVGIDITNNSDLNLVLNSMEAKSSGQIIVNGSEVTENITTPGGIIGVEVEGSSATSGDITVQNNSSSLVTFGGSISGNAISVTNTGGNILNQGGLLKANDINLTATSGQIGTEANNIYTDLLSGALNAQAAGNIYIKEISGDMALGTVDAGTACKVYLVSSGSILDGSIDETANISANYISLFNYKYTNTATKTIGTIAEDLDIDLKGIDSKLFAVAESDINIEELDGDLNVEFAGNGLQGDVKLTSAGSIIDAIDDGIANINGKNISLNANGNIGSNNTNNYMLIDTKDGAFSANSSGGDIFIKETTSDLKIGSIDAGTTGKVYITSSGSILDGSIDETANISANYISLFNYKYTSTATKTIGTIAEDLDIDLKGIDSKLFAVAERDINIEELSDDLSVAFVGNGLQGNVNLTSAGSITDSVDNGIAYINGKNISLNADSNIGSNNTNNYILIDTKDGAFSATSSGGDIFIKETTYDLKLGSIDAGTTGKVYITSSGSILDGSIDETANISANYISLFNYKYTNNPNRTIGTIAEDIDIDLKGIDSKLFAVAEKDLNIEELDGDLTVEFAGTGLQGDTILKSDGNITDAIDDGIANINGKNITLNANGNIGSNNTNNYMLIDTKDGAFSANSSGGDIFIKETTSDLNIGTIDAGTTGKVYITSSGSILDGSIDETANISANYISLFNYKYTNNPTKTIGSIAEDLDIDLKGIDSKLFVVAERDINIEEVNGDLSIAFVGNGLQGDVYLTSAGSITDSVDNGIAYINGKNISLNANGNIGSNNTNNYMLIDTKDGAFSANSSGGDIFIKETTSDLKIGAIDAGTTGKVYITSSGSILDGSIDETANISANYISLFNYKYTNTPTKTIGTIAEDLDIDLKGINSKLFVVAEKDINIEELDGDLAVEFAGTGLQGDLILKSAGSITNTNNNGSANINGKNITLTSGGTLGEPGNNLEVMYTNSIQCNGNASCNDPGEYVTAY